MDNKITPQLPTLEGNRNKIKGKLFGLLCEYEKDLDRGKHMTYEWQRFLDTILMELQGMVENEISINALTIVNRLSAARYQSYRYFRSTIFDCMSLMGD